MRDSLRAIKPLLIKAALVLFVVCFLYIEHVITTSKAKATKVTYISDVSAALASHFEVSPITPKQKRTYIKRTYSPAPTKLPPYFEQEKVPPKKIVRSSRGNTYARGNCTWYAKHKRPDLPNNLGNANTWFVRARAQGLPTGHKPVVGAIGQRGMHVVVVEKVNTNGTVRISEMNYAGYGVITQRTLPANSFRYIY